MIHSRMFFPSRVWTTSDEKRGLQITCLSDLPFRDGSWEMHLVSNFTWVTLASAGRCIPLLFSVPCQPYFLGVGIDGPACEFSPGPFFRRYQKRLITRRVNHSR